MVRVNGSLENPGHISSVGLPNSLNIFITQSLLAKNTHTKAPKKD